MDAADDDVKDVKHGLSRSSAELKTPSESSSRVEYASVGPKNVEHAVGTFLAS
jgi:hypothetical protein